MGWFDDSSFFSIFRCWWGNQMFSKSVPILEDIRRTKLMSIFRCVKVAPKSSLFFQSCDVVTCRIFLRWNEVEVFNRWLLKSSKMFRGRGKSRVVAMLWSNQNFLSFRRKLRCGRWIHLDVSFLKCRLRILEEKLAEGVHVFYWRFNGEVNRSWCSLTRCDETSKCREGPGILSV